MKTPVRRTASVALALVLAAACDGGNQGEPTGADIFAARCATCHGDEAQGLFAPALVGVAQRQPREQTIAVVTDGRGRMPAFGGQLSAQEIAAVVDYVRGL